MNQNDILNKLSICLAIVPPMYIKKFGFQSFHKLWVCILCSIVIVVSVAYFVQVISSEIFVVDTLQIIINFIDISVAVLKIIISTIRVTICKADLYRKFQTQFLQIEMTYNVKLKPYWNFYVLMIIFNILLTLSTTIVALTDSDLRSYININPINFFWFEFNHYFDVTVVLLIYNYINSFKFMFRIINRNLVRNIKIYKQFKIKIVFRDINKLRKLYANLVNAIDNFNTLFGWQILFMYMSLTLTMINFLNNVIKHYFGIGEYQHYDSFNLIAFLSTLILWKITFWAMSNAVAVIGKIATDEAKRTATVCYNLLFDLPAINNNKVNRILREELILLAHQATYRYPYFSAAGFFNLDYKMLLGLLYIIISYIVVLIEIYKQ